MGKHIINPSTCPTLAIINHPPHALFTFCSSRWDSHARAALTASNTNNEREAATNAPAGCTNAPKQVPFTTSSGARWENLQGKKRQEIERSRSSMEISAAVKPQDGAASARTPWTWGRYYLPGAQLCYLPGAQLCYLSGAQLCYLPGAQLSYLPEEKSVIKEGALRCSLVWQITAENCRHLTSLTAWDMTSTCITISTARKGMHHVWLDWF